MERSHEIFTAIRKKKKGMGGGGERGKAGLGEIEKKDNGSEINNAAKWTYIDTVSCDPKTVGLIFLYGD